MLKTINRYYCNTYYRTLLIIWDKFGDHKHWSTIQKIFNILMAKKIWYDKINRTVTPNYVMPYDKIYNNLRNIEEKMKSNYLNRIDIVYKLSFVIQSKVIDVSAVEDSTFEVDKKLLFLKFGSENFAPVFVQQLKEGLLSSFYNYLNNRPNYMKPIYRHYVNLDYQSSKIFLELMTPSEVERVEKMLNFVIKTPPKQKFKKYVKRKFGKTENVLNIQKIWSKEMSFREIVFLINKLHNLRYDYAYETVNIQDFKNV